jgi:hypothetical protein
MERFNALCQQLFQKNIVDCSVEELENLVHEYPYFAPAQYILLARLKDANSDSHQAHLQKSILYYHDPLAFDHFVNANEYEINFIALPEETLKPAQVEAEEELPKIDLVEDAAILDKVETEILVEQNQPFLNVGEQEVIADLPEEEVVIEDTPEETVHDDTQARPLLKIQEGEADADLVFEPYHTVDYFASQGIKLSKEEATRDKFGKQLKSFTEWLKTMKKLPMAEQAKPLDVSAELKVVDLAAHSVEGEEVYTEAMAEVWVRQGNNEKAKEVYNKLSLLNPSKRAYFAAKIDSLK